MISLSIDWRRKQLLVMLCASVILISNEFPPLLRATQPLATTARRIVDETLPQLDRCGLEGDQKAIVVAKSLFALERHARRDVERYAEEILLGSLLRFSSSFADVSVGEAQIKLSTARNLPIALGLRDQEIMKRLIFDTCWSLGAAYEIVFQAMKNCTVGTEAAVCARRAAATYNGQKSINGSNIEYLKVFSAVRASVLVRDGRS